MKARKLFRDWEMDLGEVSMKYGHLVVFIALGN
jgi:hypothetical protein